MRERKKERLEFSVEEDGTLRAIYSDSLKSLMEKGEAEIRRASNVEPMGDKWEVDLTPVGGPRMERLFDLREDALRAEVEWLSKNWL